MGGRRAALCGRGAPGTGESLPRGGAAGEGRITIFDHHEWYTENPSADPVKDLLAAEQHAVKAGRKGLRCGGNISWLTQQDWGPFYDYETRVTRAVHGRRILAICSYNLDLWRRGPRLRFHPQPPLHPEPPRARLGDRGLRQGMKPLEVDSRLN